MMKIILIFLITILLLIAAGIVYGEFTYTEKISGKKNENTNIDSSSSLKQDQTNTFEVELKGENYLINYFSIENPKKLFLYPNFTEKLSSKEAKRLYECKNLISGGFYTTNYKPVGLFINEGGMTQDQVKSDLFNGIFWVDYADKPGISVSYPKGSTRIALQTGPILIKDGVKQTLLIKNDELARRSIVATSQNNKIFFLMLNRKKEKLMGPNLSDLPDILAIVENDKRFKFSSAINLDGGSAASFHDENTIVEEISPVGSFFCEKN